MENNKKYRLMAPGPVALPQEIQEVLAQPMIHHRTPEFTKILASVLKELKLTFKTQQPVMMHTSTGSGAMESALVNTLSSNDEILCIISGKFGERFAEIGQTYGLKVHRLEVAWGKAVRVQDVKAALIKWPNVKAVCCQHCETSTGTINPIEQISPLIEQRPQTLFIVDAITSIGATPLHMDDWQLDVVIAGSQKAFMMPAGLSFIALSQKAWEFNKASRLPKYYFDLAKEQKANLNQQTFFSSAVTHVRALDIALKRLTLANLDEHIQRCNDMAAATRIAGSKLGLEVFSERPSPSVTAFTVPKNIDGIKLRQDIEDHHHITIMGGQDHLKGKIIRIGHLGDITQSDLALTMEAIGLSLKDLGHKITDQQIKQAKQAAESF